MAFEFKEKYDINDLTNIMQILRSEDGCPWDKEQTHQSIRNNFIEETYEVIEAIDCNSKELLLEELGDVLLQVVFHAQIESEHSSFNFDDVADGICKKLIVRHPHIFSDTIVNSADEVLSNWNDIKKQEKGHVTYAETLKAVPLQLPALMRAQKVQERAKKAGFCFPNVTAALNDLKSEIVELEQALNNNDTKNIDEEVGDVIFSAVNVARLSGINAEQSLTYSTNKFVNRFTVVEQLAKELGIDLKTASDDLLDSLWKQAKKHCIHEG